MTNSLFIELLKHIRSSINISNNDLVLSEIYEYLVWLNWSQVLYNKDYSNYISSLESLKKLVLETKDYDEIYGYIADLISCYYLISDENEV